MTESDKEFILNLFTSPETGEELKIENVENGDSAKGPAIDCGNGEETWRFRLSISEMSKCKDCGKIIEVPRDGRCDKCIQAAYAGPIPDVPDEAPPAAPSNYWP